MTPALYLHIPFCSKKCDYCDFFSTALADDETKSAVLKEMEEELSFFKDKGFCEGIRTVYIGGGTPGVIPPSVLKAFLDHISQSFGTVIEEWSLETNPETVSEDLLRVLSDSGVSRLSLGLQSMHDNLLSVLGRNGTREKNLKALDRIKALWRGDLNLDLICGIPGQTEEEAQADIEEALSFAPDHLSLYTLSLEEGTPLAEAVDSGRVSALKEKNVEDMFFLLRTYLLSRDFEDYEISNFSRRGKACLHNLAYWEMAPYLGVGPGAVSTVLSGGRVERVSHGSIHDFLSGRDSAWGQKRELIDPKDFLFEHVMMGLRLKRGLSLSRIERIFGFDLLAEHGELIDRWRERGLTAEGGRLRFIGEGRYVLNSFLRDFLASVEKKEVCIRCWPDPEPIPRPKTVP